MRNELRRLRRGLSPGQQQNAAASLLARIRDLDCYRASARLACYMAIDGEAAPAQLLAHALERGKSCFLPRVAGADRLDFVAYKAGDQLVESNWGIPEPILKEAVDPAEFDLVLVPLLGFSRDCQRLGNGRGYYDRAFAFRLENPDPRPLLLGLAHECQLVESLPAQPWDVPLDAVATPARIYWRGKDG